ncbi:hypothetical protein [Marininema halotolerans]|uniref:Uncharacterized protein n=1 Tax=Marininema halotolerans TaxID=1155944 RepID=A0A1I6URQ6_9BACL|nr:hypothetical protein [Marininema halotolerans]SFT04014.1 hypothetical protein SAMN05444972_11930 [Marininema halotolerans]
MREDKDGFYTLTTQEVWEEIRGMRRDIQGMRSDFAEKHRDSIELARDAIRDAAEAKAQAQLAVSKTDRFIWWLLGIFGSVIILAVKILIFPGG